MRVGHYLRVAWLLTELGESSVFPRMRTRASETQDIVTISCVSLARVRIRGKTEFSPSSINNSYCSTFFPNVRWTVVLAYQIQSA